MAQLSDLKVACIATDGFEESELTEPVRQLDDLGAKVDIIGLKPGKIQAFHHHDKTIQMDVDKVIDEVEAHQYDALLLPGGALSADTLRAVPKVLEFVRAFEGNQRPIAVICHGSWTLISAGLVEGHTLTSYYTIKDDVFNAGGDWVDEEVVVDRNWVSSRKPDDLPAFCREMVNLFSHSVTKGTRITEEKPKGEKAA